MPYFSDWFVAICVLLPTDGKTDIRKIIKFHK